MTKPLLLPLRLLFSLTLLPLVTPSCLTYPSSFYKCSAGCYYDPSLTPCHPFCPEKQCHAVSEGYYSPMDDDDRYPCPAGTYSNVDTAEYCRPCPPGTSDSGSSSGSAGSSLCLPCSQGNYADGSGSITCKSCDGSYYGGEGSSAVVTVDGTQYCLKDDKMRPSSLPSMGPTMTTRQPSDRPSVPPTITPSFHPSGEPSVIISGTPSQQPSIYPTESPTESPTPPPSLYPTVSSTHKPSLNHSNMPSRLPTGHPTTLPSFYPTMFPTTIPSFRPSNHPSVIVSGIPSRQPSFHPTISPSAEASVHPSNIPSYHTSYHPTALHSPDPSHSVFPSMTPSFIPSTLSPIMSPSARPTGAPSKFPSAGPSLSPSHNPTLTKSSSPSFRPSLSPSSQPMIALTVSPSLPQPSVRPTGISSSTPPSIGNHNATSLPSISPTNEQSHDVFTHHPSSLPTAHVFTSENPSYILSPIPSCHSNTRTTATTTTNNCTPIIPESNGTSWSLLFCPSSDDDHDDDTHLRQYNKTCLPCLLLPFSLLSIAFAILTYAILIKIFLIATKMTNNDDSGRPPHDYRPRWGYYYVAIDYFHRLLFLFLMTTTTTQQSSSLSSSSSLTLTTIPWPKDVRDIALFLSSLRFDDPLWNECILHRFDNAVNRRLVMMVIATTMPLFLYLILSCACCGRRDRWRGLIVCGIYVCHLNITHVVCQHLLIDGDDDSSSILSAVLAIVYVIVVPLAVGFVLWRPVNNHVIRRDMIAYHLIHNDVDNEDMPSSQPFLRNNYACLYLPFQPHCWYWSFVVLIRNSLLCLLTITSTTILGNHMTLYAVINIAYAIGVSFLRPYVGRIDITPLRRRYANDIRQIRANIRMKRGVSARAVIPARNETRGGDDHISAPDDGCSCGFRYCGIHCQSLSSRGWGCCNTFDVISTVSLVIVALGGRTLPIEPTDIDNNRNETGTSFRFIMEWILSRSVHLSLGYVVIVVMAEIVACFGGPLSCCFSNQRQRRGSGEASSSSESEFQWRENPLHALTTRNRRGGDSGAEEETSSSTPTTKTKRLSIVTAAATRAVVNAASSSFISTQRRNSCRDYSLVYDDRVDFDEFGRCRDSSNRTPPIMNEIDGIS